MTARPTVINPTTSIPDAATLISRGHFRHLPVSGDTGLIGMLDITDVCRGLSTPTSPSGPPPATPGLGSPSGTARGQISVQNTAICAPAGRRLQQPDEARFGSGLAGQYPRNTVTICDGYSAFPVAASGQVLTLMAVGT